VQQACKLCAIELALAPDETTGCNPAPWPLANRTTTSQGEVWNTRYDSIHHHLRLVCGHNNHATGICQLGCIRCRNDRFLGLIPRQLGPTRCNTRTRKRTRTLTRARAREGFQSLAMDTTAGLDVSRDQARLPPCCSRAVRAMHGRAINVADSLATDRPGQSSQALPPTPSN
jgi:hypothetical protein